MFFEFFDSFFRISGPIANKFHRTHIKFGDLIIFSNEDHTLLEGNSERKYIVDFYIISPLEPGGWHKALLRKGVEKCLIEGSHSLQRGKNNKLEEIRG